MFAASGFTVVLARHAQATVKLHLVLKAIHHMKCNEHVLGTPCHQQFSFLVTVTCVLVQFFGAPSDTNECMEAHGKFWPAGTLSTTAHGTPVKCNETPQHALSHPDSRRCDTGRATILRISDSTSRSRVPVCLRRFLRRHLRR